MPPRLKVWSALRTLRIGASPPSRWQPARLSIPVRNLMDQAPNGSGLHDHNTFGDDAPPELDVERRANEEDRSKILAELASSDATQELELAVQSLELADPDALPTHKFPLPTLPLPSRMSQKHRYDPVLVQLTRLLMRDGKLSKAEREMGMILNYLRTSPPPKINPLRPLLPGSPPASHLPLDPVRYLRLVIDSVAPLIRVRMYQGLAGGGASLEMPVPLAERQRRRAAFTWILDVVNKKPSRGSGRTQFAHRVAEEIVAVAEGRSPVWEKRHMVHRMGTSARANVNHSKLRMKGGGGFKK